MHSHLSPSAISVESDGHFCISAFNPTGQLGFILMTVSLQWQAVINSEIEICVGVCGEARLGSGELSRLTQALEDERRRAGEQEENIMAEMRDRDAQMDRYKQELEMLR